MLMDAGGLVAWASPALTLIGMIIATYLYVSSQVSGVRMEAVRHADAVRTELIALTDAARREASLQAEKVAQAESKARHAQANGTLAITTRLENDLDRLRRETVRREEFAALEARIVASVNEVKTKVDGLTEKLSLLHVLQAQTKTNGDRLEKVLERLETKGGNH